MMITSNRAAVFIVFVLIGDQLVHMFYGHYTPSHLSFNVCMVME